MTKIWGMSYWHLFHTLTIRFDESKSDILIPQIIDFIKKICSILPCSICIKDSLKELKLLNRKLIKNKHQLIQAIFTFHNNVNKKLNKKLFLYNDLKKYNNIHIINAYNTYYSYSNKSLKSSFDMVTIHERHKFTPIFKKWVISNIPNLINTHQF
jgi:hypothetical protein